MLFEKNVALVWLYALQLNTIYSHITLYEHKWEKLSGLNF